MLHQHRSPAFQHRYSIPSAVVRMDIRLRKLHILRRSRRDRDELRRSRGWTRVPGISTLQSKTVVETTRTREVHGDTTLVVSTICSVRIHGARSVGGGSVGLMDAVVRLMITLLGMSKRVLGEVPLEVVHFETAVNENGRRRRRRGGWRKCCVLCSDEEVFEGFI
jgi:hypothetical protein